MAGGYRYHPNPDVDPIGGIKQKFDAMDREIKALRRSLTGIGIRVDPKTNSVIMSSGQGRSLTVTDEDGRRVAVIGALPEAYNRADGSRQPGLVFYREDGSTAALLGDLSATVPPFKQSWQVLDRAGQVVFADDTNSGHGIAKPYLSGGIQFVNTNTAGWPATTNPTMTKIISGQYHVANPRVQFGLEIQADDATTGVFQVQVNGTAIATSEPLTGGFIVWNSDKLALPSDVQIDDIVNVDLLAQRAAGTGTVRAAFVRWEGDQSP